MKNIGVINRSVSLIGLSAMLAGSLSFHTIWTVCLRDRIERKPARLMGVPVGRTKITTYALALLAIVPNYRSETLFFMSGGIVRA